MSGALPVKADSFVLPCSVKSFMVSPCSTTSDLRKSLPVKLAGIMPRITLYNVLIRIRELIVSSRRGVKNGSVVSILRVLTKRGGDDEKNPTSLKSFVEAWRTTASTW
jgi:hypothetical protein